MRIEMTADDGRTVEFADAGTDKYVVTIYSKAPHPDATVKKLHQFNGLMLKKADVKRLAKAS